MAFTPDMPFIFLANASSAASVMQGFITPAIATLCGLASLAAVFFLVMGGIQYMTSAGNPDKLAGEISQEKYVAKHGEFREQKAKLHEQLQTIDKSAGNRLDQTLVLLELSQRAAEIYAKRTPQQKRLIITKLFQNMVLDGSSLSVGYTDFTGIIAKNVVETKKLTGGQK